MEKKLKYKECWKLNDITNELRERERENVPITSFESYNIKVWVNGRNFLANYIRVIRP